MNLENQYKKAAEYLKNADALFITAGAGMGVDSGLPDFRGKEGFWREYPPIAKLGLRFEEMANPYWFERDPQLAWAFYGHRLNLYRQTQPHKGFKLILDFANQLNFKYFVFTSNVDGQFQKAGFDQDRIEEVHGSIHYLQCSVPCSEEIWSAEKVNIKIDMKKFRAEQPLPKCPHCGAIARPNILMFGDWNWIPHRYTEQRYKLNSWLYNLQKNNAKLVILEIGAGSAVPTVRHKSEAVAREMNAPLIRINPREYQVPNPNFDVSIPDTALNALENIFKML